MAQAGKLSAATTDDPSGPRTRNRLRCLIWCVDRFRSFLLAQTTLPFGIFGLLLLELLLVVGFFFFTSFYSPFVTRFFVFPSAESEPGFFSPKRVKKWVPEQEIARFLPLDGGLSAGIHVFKHAS